MYDTYLHAAWTTHSTSSKLNEFEELAAATPVEREYSHNARYTHAECACHTALPHCLAPTIDAFSLAPTLGNRAIARLLSG